MSSGVLSSGAGVELPDGFRNAESGFGDINGGDNDDVDFGEGDGSLLADGAFVTPASGKGRRVSTQTRVKAAQAQAQKSQQSIDSLVGMAGEIVKGIQERREDTDPMQGMLTKYNFIDEQKKRFLEDEDLSPGKGVMLANICRTKKKKLGDQVLAMHQAELIGQQVAEELEAGEDSEAVHETPLRSLPSEESKQSESH
ncbi:hypothetical protein THAOC_16358 [Thalassiosira oceanica]|uniref:Uncharacterized protein n=1 Tax=Thalassiosira oceanica TaxID=159749 RepID=K0SDH4_THAOC|nr:hypothetical protein THAOC_16358 [Thalassiosira oceanica]|eukprot:EJK63009.1 hypothetical protein THAOC_16358 [Thalassiosira oceanica]